MKANAIRFEAARVLHQGEPFWQVEVKKKRPGGGWAFAGVYLSSHVTKGAALAETIRKMIEVEHG